MDAILKWIGDVAVYLILVTLILQVIPKKFRKYISFFTGMLLIMLVISPITGLFGADAALVDYFKLEDMKQAVSDMEDMIRFTENVSEKKMIEGYNGQIKERISELIIGYGFRVNEVQVMWNLDADEEDYGSITGIYVQLDEKTTPGTITIEPVKVTVGEQLHDAYTEKEILEMKAKIAGFYNLSEAHINITIQG